MNTLDSWPITGQFSILTGALIRGRTKKEILGYCFSHGIEVTVEEDKGFWESLYYFKVATTYDKWNKLIVYIKSLPGLVS